MTKRDLVVRIANETGLTQNDVAVVRIAGIPAQAVLRIEPQPERIASRFIRALFAKEMEPLLDVATVGRHLYPGRNRAAGLTQVFVFGVAE